jgi:hypothetical protein
LRARLADVYGLGATLAHCSRPGASRTARELVEFVARCALIDPDRRPASAAACLAFFDALASR